MMAVSKKTKSELLTEIKRLQEELEIATSNTNNAPIKWEALAKNSPNEIYVLNKDAGIVATNRNDNYSVKNIGKKLLALVPKKFQTEAKKAIQDAFKKGVYQEYKTERIIDGERYYFKNKITPTKDKTKVTGAILEIEDCSADIVLQDKLERSEQKYEDFLNQILSGVIIYVDFRLVFANKAAFELFGMKKTKGLNEIEKDIFNYVSPSYQKLLKNRIKRLLNGESVKASEFEVKTPSGEILFLETKPSKIYYKGNQAVQVTFNDITNRKRIEKSVKDSQNNLTQVLKNINELVYYVEFLPNGEKRLNYIGKQIETIFGVTLKEYKQKGKKLWSLCHPDDKSKISQATALVRKTRQPQEIVYRFLHRKKKQYIWVEERIIPQIDDKGNYTGNFGLIKDVTTQINYEQRLNEEKLTAQNYLDVANVVLVVINRDQTVALINKVGCQLLGYKEKEIIGKNWFDHFVPKNECEKTRAAFEKAIHGKLVRDQLKESQIVSKKGEKRTMSWKSSLIYDDKGVITSILSSGEDITERIIAETALKDSEKRFRILSNATFEGIVFTENECIIDANDQFTKLFGFKDSKALIGKNFITDFFVPNQWAMVRQQMQKIKSTPFEGNIITKTGIPLTVEAKGQWIPYFGRKIRATVIYDVTDRQQYQKKLEQSRQNYKSLIDNSPNGILIYYKNALQFANKAAVKLFEADSFSQIHLKENFSLLLPEYRERAKERVKQASAGAVLPFVEVKIKTLKGNILTLESKPIAIKYKDQDAIQIVMQDVNPQKQLIKEQLRAQIAEETNSSLQQEIYERKQAERTLQQAQKYTRLLIDSSLDMICASDKEGYITEFNSAAEKTFGYERSEIIGRHVSVLYANSPQRIKNAYEYLYEKGRFAGEVVNVKKDGQKFIAYLSASVLRNDIGELVGAMGVSRDISEMKRAEQELRNSEERYRAIYDQVFVGIAKISLNGKFIQVNEQMCNMLGYTKEELCSKTFMDITAKEDIPASVSVMKKLASGQIEKTTFEKRYLHKTGKIINANIATSLVVDALGNPSHIISIFQNITEKVKLEHDRQSQSARHNAIIESSSHIIWTTDKQMCLTSFNKNYAADLMKHYNVQAYIGLSVVSVKVVLTEEYNNYWLKKYEAVLRGEHQYFETKMIDRQNNVVWREIFLNPIFDELGNLVEVAGIGLDITEKKLANEQIHNSLQEKEVLLKEVHHRVKNNLQVISSILNLQSSYVKDQSTLNILKESQDRIKSMAFIHESLYQTKDFSSINFSEYVVNLSQNLLHSYSSLEHEIKLNLDIQNVFLNLDLAIPCGLIINEIVSNALKYAFVDKMENAEIMIKMHLVGEDLQLQIKDNGVGLPKHIDYRNTESLGLQLVVTLVDQLNGNIELDCTAGAHYNILFKQNQVKNRI